VTPGSIRIGSAELSWVAAGSGTPLVFVHGGLADRRYWESQIPAFAPRWRAISYSRRHAWPNENRPLAADYSPRTDARDLAGLIERVAGGPAHIVAASIGACAALFVASERPELVRSLVVLEPPLLRWLLDLPGGRAVWDEFMTDVWDAAAHAFAAGQPERGVAAFIDYFLGPGRYDRLPARVRARIMQNAAELEAQTRSTDQFPLLERSAAAALPMPVLMLSGALTRPTHALVDAELERVLSDGRRIVVPGASHDVWADRADECVKATLGFLADVEAGWKDA
jgi:non-heme chloroperoxidase